MAAPPLAWFCAATWSVFAPALTVGVQLDPGGGIVDGTIRLLDPAVLPDSRYEAAFRAARIALLRCAPYRGLPSDKYGLWRDPQITFGPEGLLWW